MVDDMVDREEPIQVAPKAMAIKMIATTIVIIKLMKSARFTADIRGDVADATRTAGTFSPQARWPLPREVATSRMNFFPA